MSEELYRLIYSDSYMVEWRLHIAVKLHNRNFTENEIRCVLTNNMNRRVLAIICKERDLDFKEMVNMIGLLLYYSFKWLLVLIYIRLVSVTIVYSIINQTKLRTMTIVRVKFCEGFIKALQNYREFPDLYMYCSPWLNTIEGDTLMCKLVQDIDLKTNKPVTKLDIELALFDYFFNIHSERDQLERDNLWKAVGGIISRTVVAKQEI